MSNKDTGGPAFPEHHYFDPDRGQYGQHMTASDVGRGGMSLRDWFAGQALIGYLAETKHPDNATPSIVAKWCYANADAMLAEKRRREGAAPHA